MRGQVLEFDAGTGAGLISGDDGRRYAFTRADLQGGVAPTPGAGVDFVPDADNARQIYVLNPGAAAYAPRPFSPQEATGEDLSLWGYFIKAMRLSFNGDGRARRKEYWGFTLFSVLICFTVTVLAVAAVVALESVASGRLFDGVWSGDVWGFSYSDGHHRHNVGFRWPTPGTIGIVVLTLFVYLFFFPASVTVSIRRLHDVGMTGWLYLIPLLLWNFGGGIFMFVVALIPSQRQVNQWGLYPKPI